MKEGGSLRHAIGNAYAPSRDLSVVLEECESTQAQYLESPFLSSSSYSTPLRRARADTMPSILPEQSHTTHVFNTSSSGRHRSGSLHLPTLFDPPVFGQSWIQPLKNDVLGTDSESSIACTLRSIGLEDSEEHIQQEQHQRPAEHRSRSYSVNAAGYQESRVAMSTTTFIDRIVGNQPRQRAASMGPMDYSPVWQWTPLPDQPKDTALSLGDSELLANMFQDTADQQEVYAGEQSIQDQSTPQIPSRSLWIGNIDRSITAEYLTHIFSIYGPIESVRLLMEKECAFINFCETEDAIHAKDEVLGRLNGKVGQCTVRVGYGRAEAVSSEANVLRPTRALWLGNLPPNTTSGILEQLFTAFGPVESVRVLSYKNCAFINFERIDSAVAAKEALLTNDGLVQRLPGTRVGFAKISPAKPQTVDSLAVSSKSSKKSNDTTNIATKNPATSTTNNATKSTTAWILGIERMLKECEAENIPNIVKGLKTSTSYFESIPPVPGSAQARKHDAGKLREVRRRLDSTTKSEDADIIAQSYMDDMAELSSDYIGNTVVQRLFEKCGEGTKTVMLERVAPHLAAISVHKNGTWAAQKIIETVCSPAHIQLVCHHLKPYIPSLLLDPFGNYAVQCCIRLGPEHNQFVFYAMAQKIFMIAQGRFGARATRGILESSFVTLPQQQLIAAALLYHVDHLAVHSNGAILLSWLMDSSLMEQRTELMANLFAPHLSLICTHKLGSQMVLKIINQTTCQPAQQIIVNRLLEPTILDTILIDPVRGVSFVQKACKSSHLAPDEQKRLIDRVTTILVEHQGPTYTKLLQEISVG
ncbi:armadillo-type protein [Phycomyces nitens]|nr:armadillo-type protein [Phycomyces nitens]